jgi:hypothetical protein
VKGKSEERNEKVKNEQRNEKGKSKERNEKGENPLHQIKHLIRQKL